MPNDSKANQLFAIQPKISPSPKNQFQSLHFQPPSCQSRTIKVQNELKKFNFYQQLNKTQQSIKQHIGYLDLKITRYRFCLN